MWDTPLLPGRGGREAGPRFNPLFSCCFEAEFPLRDVVVLWPYFNALCVEPITGSSLQFLSDMGFLIRRHRGDCHGEGARGDTACALLYTLSVLKMLHVSHASPVTTRVPSPLFKKVRGSNGNRVKCFSGWTSL